MTDQSVEAIKSQNLASTQSALFLAGYFVLAVLLPSWIDQLGSYAMYIAEALFVVWVLYVFRENYSGRYRMWTAPDRFVWLGLCLGFGSGFGIHFLAQKLDLGVPFDFSCHETWVLLLLVGPLLEEALFRQALWFLLEVFVKKKTPSTQVEVTQSNLNWPLIFISAALFSGAHFYSFFFVPAGFSTFVLFQTAYTFLLGVGLSVAFSRTRAFWVPWALHTTFNLGFALAILI